MPNMLSAVRLVLSPCIGYAIVHHQLPLALGMFCVAGVTDLVRPGGVGGGG